MFGKRLQVSPATIAYAHSTSCTIISALTVNDYMPEQILSAVSVPYMVIDGVHMMKQKDVTLALHHLAVLTTWRLHYYDKYIATVSAVCRHRLISYCYVGVELSSIT